ncbi:MAG: hypothetical protein MJ066_03265, partial [Clostridia bacterium]|nr:hypothetical protein [Clostridia bacterium]
FGIIFLFYSIKPIVYLDFDNIVNNYEVNLSTFSAENNLANQIIEESSKNCDKIIKNLGISGAKVVIEYTVENESFVKIKKVKINLKNCSYNGNINHKDIQRKLKNCLSISLNISEDDIVLSE